MAGELQETGETHSQLTICLNFLQLLCPTTLGVYGGFFSGGYVAMLTTVLIVFFSITFIEAVAVTKVLNLFSSLVATAVFGMRGLIDWKLGLTLGFCSFAGAIVGAMVARRLSYRLLRRLFFAAVLGLAVKTLLYDARW